ncbi:flagellar hook-length control protein FliK [Sphingomonas sp. LT1P40]|uniref:flagellar hook-length control protein FliK n=1 Tax=Alteristakelama amylovorans TaxID=3096166 RepID=UPI002FCA0D91
MFNLLSIKLPGLTPAVPLRAAPVARVPVADFMAALGAMLIPGITAKGDGERQVPAEGGKDLPDEAETPDPLLAWLPDGMASVQVEVRLAPGLALTGTMPAPPEAALVGEIAPFAGADPAPVETPIIAPAAERETIDTAPIVEATAEPDFAPVAVDPEPVIEPQVKSETPVRDRIEPRAARPITPPPLALPPHPQSPVAAAPAGQMFAAAFAIPVADSAKIPTAGADPIEITASLQTDQLRTTVQAMSATDQAPLDLSRDDWAGAMIDRIAAMQDSARDAAEATDTRIRLAPENLGALEISIRRDGDRLHVHFTAENSTTRQLLADAASQLVELANARGVKLGGTSVDGGTGGQPGTPHQSEPKGSTRPASAAASGPKTDPNERIA